MLPIEIPKGEYWDEAKEEFLHTKAYTLRLEHSLISISKWESKWHISFFETKLNPEQFLSYIKCMSLSNDVPDEAYGRLGEKEITEIIEYINDPMTASSVHEKPGTRAGREVVTSELIYYWMTKFNIPWDCEKWHINRLIMLIRICIAKENGGQKMSKAETYAKQAQIRARNRAKFRK